MNFFVEKEEINNLFGKQVQLSEQQSFDDCMKVFGEELREKYGGIEKGLETVFKKFDADGSGSLSREEFLIALDRSFGKLTEEQKLIILENADKNRDNYITLQEFKDWVFSYESPEQRAGGREKPKEIVLKKDKPLKLENYDQKKSQYSPQALIVHYLRLECNHFSSSIL